MVDDDRPFTEYIGRKIRHIQIVKFSNTIESRIVKHLLNHVCGKRLCGGGGEEDEKQLKLREEAGLLR